MDFLHSREGESLRTFFSFRDKISYVSKNWEYPFHLDSRCCAAFGTGETIYLFFTSRNRISSSF
jgi:hypothetical protein